jgi:putative transposase
MKKSRYSEAQIVSILKQAENGVPVSELCRTHGMSSAAFYQWRSKYGGTDASLISEMKHLQAENARLKRMYADLGIQNELVKKARAKSNEATHCRQSIA